MTRKRQWKIRRTVIGGLLLILMICGVELLARALLLPPWAAPPDADSFRWTAEYQRYENNIENWEWTDAGYMVPADRTGMHVNYRGGFRVTIGQPSADVPAVWLFGSSALLETELDDSETIPSHLQAALGNHYRVVNVGAPGAVVFHQYKRMKDLPILPHDIVIFYDGGSEVRALRDLMRVRANCENLPAISIIARTICDSLIRANKADLENMERDYRQRIQQAREWAEERAIRFVHILEPNMYEVPLSPWERWFMRNFEGLEGITRQAWPYLRQSETDLDFTNLVDTCRQEGACWYYTTYHLNSTGNRIIAAEMAKWIDQSEVL